VPQAVERVDRVSSGVKAVAGFDRRCLEVFGAEYRVDEVVVASDEGRVEVDLGSDAPGDVRGPDEAWWLAHRSLPAVTRSAKHPDERVTYPRS